MKILLIHQYFLEPDDGGGSRFNEMTKFWSSKGHHITVIAGMMHGNGKEKRKEYKGRYFMKKQHDKVEVIRCHVSESYNNGFLGRLWGYFSFVFSSIWAGLFKTNKSYDIILVTSPPLFLGITAYILSILKRTPFLFEVRDLWPESAIDTGVVTNKLIIKFAYWFESFVYRKARLINVLTPAFRSILINKKGIAKEKISFVPNAADFAISDEILNSDFDETEFRRSIGLEGKTVITYVGAHGVANHLIQVIDTAELMRENQRVVFQLIGGGMQKEMLINEVEKRGLQNVVFVDPVPKHVVFKYILSSDFGMSVLKEVDTFKTIYSNKTFDYMACKKPIFMLIDGVSRELVEKAECGVFVEPENPEDFKQKIEMMIQKKDNELSTLGQLGYEYAKANFDRTNLSLDYLHHIQSIV